MNVGGKLQKNGGNVGSYFCTPNGRLIHAVVGPVNAATLVAEANWAIAAYRPIAHEDVAGQMQYLESAHHAAIGQSVRHGEYAAALPQPVANANSRQVHHYLAKHPLALLDSVYVPIFEKIVGEEISESDSHINSVARALRLGKQKGKPLLFVIHEEGYGHGRTRWNDFVNNRDSGGLMRRLRFYYSVVVLPLEDVPALSRSLQYPLKAPKGEFPLFIVARGNGEQIGSVTGWKSRDQLFRVLAQGLVEAFKSNPPDNAKIQRVAELLQRIDPGLAAETRSLLETYQQTDQVAFSG